jgi:hypothetical protein
MLIKDKRILIFLSLISIFVICYSQTIYPYKALMMFSPSDYRNWTVESIRKSNFSEEVKLEFYLLGIQDRNKENSFFCIELISTYDKKADKLLMSLLFLLKKEKRNDVSAAICYCIASILSDGVASHMIPFLELKKIMEPRYEELEDKCIDLHEYKKDLIKLQKSRVPIEYEIGYILYTLSFLR